MQCGAGDVFCTLEQSSVSSLKIYESCPLECDSNKELKCDPGGTLPFLHLLCILVTCRVLVVLMTGGCRAGEQRGDLLLEGKH